MFSEVAAHKPAVEEVASLDFVTMEGQQLWQAAGGRDSHALKCMNWLFFFLEKAINAALSHHILTHHAEQWQKSCGATFTPHPAKLNQMIKVIFSRQLWPFLWIMNECLIYTSFFFLIISDKKNMARWEANDSKEKPVCKRGHLMLDEYKCAQCTRVSVLSGIKANKTCSPWSVDVSSENEPNALRCSRMTTKTSCCRYSRMSACVWKTKHTQVKEAKTTLV